MWEYVKLNVMLMVALVCGPLFAVLLSFYVDVISLSQQYKFLQHINYDWKLLMVFGIFWLGIYCALAFWSTLKRLIYKAPKLEWWQTEAIYHIYVKSFFDANGDGVGDLRGIIQKLDYIQNLGTRAILLSPFYPSGGKDGGFDVTSFIDVDPAYGSIKDFDELVDQVHRRDMHLIIDFVPTHTSSQHQWFVESCKDEANNRFKDFYIWHPSKDSQTPPNNWKSIYGGPAWTYVESRKAWYFHNYLPEQPSLNLRCADVKGELESVMTFWLERKRVDGLRLESAEHLFVSEKFENEPVANKFKPSDQLEYADFRHVHTTNLPATFELLNEWRRVVCSLSKRNKSDKVLIVNPTIGDYQLDKFYNYENKKGAHLAINPQLCGLSQKPVDKLLTDDSKLFKPRNLKSLIEDYLGQLPKNAWTSWQLGDHYVSRVASRIGSENVNLANALNLLLGGTSVVYYGEEIGMEDLSKESLKFEECQDELGRRRGSDGYLQSSRDFERTPMQWDNTNFAGFTRFNRTWLPVNPNFKEINVQVQTGHKRSTLSIFRDLIELRHHASFQYGAVKMVTVNDQVFSFLRKAFGCDVYLICMNMSDSNANVNLLVSNEIAPRAYVALYIPGTFYAENGCVGAVEDIDLEAKYKAKSAVLTKNVFLKAHDCLVLTWPTSD